MDCNKLADELPYEKFKKHGPESLTDAELLAIIIRTGTSKEDSVSLGRHILQLQGNRWGLSGIHHFSVKDFMKVHGIGEVKAVKIKCICEIAKRMSQENASETLSFHNPASVAAYYMERFRHLEKEKTLLVMLNNKNHLIRDEIVSEGTVNATLLSPRDIFIKALHEGAVNIMLLHNHPSGDPTPSKQDILLTQKLKNVSDLLEIPLLDHIIIGDNQYISLKEKRLF